MLANFNDCVIFAVYTAFCKVSIKGAFINLLHISVLVRTHSFSCESTQIFMHLDPATHVDTFDACCILFYFCDRF